MKVISTIVFLAAVTVASAINFCPRIQEIDWEIELLLPHRDCNKFIQCTHGEPVERSCPEGLYFSIIKNRCEWRDLVECGYRIVHDEPQPKDNDNNSTVADIVKTEKPDLSIVEFLPNGCPVDGEIHWLVSHEKFCNLFYYCVQGEKDLRRCPLWLHFNSKLQVCDWPWNAGCEELRATDYVN